MKNYIKMLTSKIYIHIFGGKGEYADLLDLTAKVYPKTLSSTEVKKIRDKIDEIIAVKDEKKVWIDEYESDHRIFKFEDYFEESIKILGVEEKIIQIEKYLGRKIKSWTLMAAKMDWKERNIGSGGGLHRDSPYSNQIKIIWYLNDVMDNNGPFTYIDKTNDNLWSDRNKYKIGEWRFADANSDDQLIEVKGEGGTMLVCDTKCIHGGKKMTGGTRYAITLYTFPNKNGKEEIIK